jgi:hypothetical protein
MAAMTIAKDNQIQLGEPAATRGDWRPIVIAIAIFSTLSIWAAIKSYGFLEADACTHYQYARFAFQQPHYFVNVWGRPICTAIYSVPAVLGGRLGVRFMSLLLALGCALVAYRIATNQGYRWPSLALIFTLAQPLVFLHSFSELTELPFAFLLGLAFLAYQARRWFLFAVLIGLTPLSRPEGFGFLALGAIALIAHRRWYWLPLLLVPLIGWDVAGWMLGGREGPWWRWLPSNWPYATDSLYARGNILHFVGLLPVIVSPLLVVPMLLGIVQNLRNAAKDSTNHAPSTIDGLIAIIPLMILIGHSVLYALGKMASNGEARYMLVVAPFWGLLSAKGWEWIWTRLDWRWPLRAAGVAALAPILANFYWGVVPLTLYTDWTQARDIVKWYESSPISKQYPRLSTGHQALYYFMGIPGNDSQRGLDFRRDTLLPTPPKGVLIVWDPVYAVFNSDARRKVPLEELIDAGWIDVTDRVPDFGKGWRILVSPQDATGATTLPAEMR